MLCIPFFFNDFSLFLWLVLCTKSWCCVQILFLKSLYFDAMLNPVFISMCPTVEIIWCYFSYDCNFECIFIYCTAQWYLGIALYKQLLIIIIIEIPYHACRFAINVHSYMTTRMLLYLLNIMCSSINISQEHIKNWAKLEYQTINPHSHNTSFLPLPPSTHTHIT